MEVGFQSFSNNMQDAFQVIWTHLKGYASPPFTLKGRALNKVLKEKAILLLITPAWQTLLLSTTVKTHSANTITSTKT